MSSGVPEGMKPPLYRLANELIRPNLPPSELVYHEHFGEMAKALSERPHVLSSRKQALESLIARSFTAALIDRINVEELECEWAKASKAIWPLSIWRKTKLKKRLKAYMSAAGTPEPELDLPLLQEYRQAAELIARNNESLGLSPRLQAAVEKDTNALDTQLDASLKLRQAIAETRASLASAKKASGGNLGVLTQTARQLYGPGREVEASRVKLRDNLSQLSLTPALQATVENDANALDTQLRSARTIREALTAVGLTAELQSQAIKSLSKVPEPRRRDAATEIGTRAKSFQAAWVEYTKHAADTPASLQSRAMIADARAHANHVLARRTALRQWTAWASIRKQAETAGLSEFIKALESGELKAADASARFRLAYARWWLPRVVDSREPLRTFQKFLHEDVIRDFCKLDDLARKAAAPRRDAVLHGLPSSDQVPRKSELGLLRHQIGLKRPSKSIREIIIGMPETFGKLAPCLLMSPLSIAQYLPANQTLFDVVVFDEASQIATWDAIGAMRGKQTIIVGDPKQLPPTNFFGRTENDEDNAELDDHEKDLESILDKVQASGLPTLQLNWHYRSRHESLIAFSNWHYYGNKLVTFPAADSVARGVSLRHIKEGVYDRGKSRTNRQEAEAIVADAVERMKRCIRKPEDKRLTYGVITFNSQQQELIQNLFDEALGRHPELEWFFSDDRIEPTVVKNLESVQGDERDIMMFSITFGRDAAGKFPVDFGAINRDGGERRLNVAVTRARRELVVYSSFLSDQLCAERSNARGVHDLKAFLEYAEKGPQAIVARTELSAAGHDSPFEEAVSASLQKQGWRIDAQVGVSGFRIDLGIIHPDKPGAYLAGIECDGATYHRSAIARDRDKTRQRVLEDLGWTIVRIWSTDWWYDPDTAIETIDAALKELLEGSRQAAQDDELVSPASMRDEQATESGNDFEDSSRTAEVAKVPSDMDLVDTAISEVTEEVLRPQLVASQATQLIRRTYSRCLLDDSSGNQHRFFEADYSVILRQMAMSMIESLGPIRDDVLVREVAKAHGFGRMTTRIKERVLELLPNVTVSEESVGRFLWPGQVAEEIVPFRYAANDAERRSLDEISMAELLGLVRDVSTSQLTDDPALALAREMGLARLARSARDRLEAALDAYNSKP